MIDIHTHILPNVDDGCKSLEEARECLLMCKKNGVDSVILTPHYSIRDKKEKLINAFEEFKKQVSDIDINIYFGAEMMYSRGFLKALREKKAITLNDSEYLLIEFELFDAGYDIRSSLYDIKCLGYKIILAHPERYSYISIKELEQLKRDGVLFQVNTTSLNGSHGTAIKNRALQLHKLKMIDFISSDCHSPNGLRSPNLDESYLKYVNNVKKIVFK